MADSRPFTNGGDGDRDERGRFQPGNPGGPGNPHAAKVASLRAVFFKSVTDDDICEVVQALIGEAKSGNIPAIREFFARVLGAPEAVDLMAQLANLEPLVEDRL